MSGSIGTRLRARALALASGVLALAAGSIAGCGGGGSTAPAGRIDAAWVQPAVHVEHDVFQTSSQAVASASLTVQAQGLGYWFRYRHDPDLAEVSYTFRAVDDGIDFEIVFPRTAQRAPGSYAGTLDVTLCHDEACEHPVPGSPFSLPLRLDVGYFAQAEAGVTPLLPQQTTALDHDVRGAGYSAALDAVVTVSALPAPLLRVHELRSGVTRSQPLPGAPSSLALAADGLRAAVGHDGGVSLVDLRAGAASPVTHFDVPMPVGRVLLTGTRIVAVGAQVFGWNSIYWVDAAAGTSTQAGSAVVYGAVDAVLHPGGDRIYLADRGLSPDDVMRMDLGGDVAAAQVHGSRYHGEHPFCGSLAIAPGGHRLYTGCGVVLGTAPALADDMLYAGRMALSPADPATSQPYVAAALSVAPDDTSVALLEQNQHFCDARSERLDACHTRVAVHDTATLARSSLHGLAPYQRGGGRLQQWGRHLMHRSDGSLLVLAEARTRDEAVPTWLLHRVSP